MSVFSWLIVGHFVGDWLLQNDWMATGKRRGLVTKPGMVHFAVYTVAVLAALGVSGAAGQHPDLLLLAGGIVFVSHWLVDATNAVDGWMRFYRQTDLAIVRIMVDQTFHLLVLAALGLAIQGRVIPTVL